MSSTLTTLSPELQYLILNHLDSEDLFNLLFVCKSIYQIVHGELGSTLGCVGRWASVQGDSGKCRCKDKNSYKRLWQINEISQESIPFDLKWEYIKTIGVCSQSLQEKADCELIANLIDTGRLRPRSCVLKFNRRSESMNIDDKLWKSLREYFDSKGSNQLSLLISIRDYNISSALHFIDGHCDKVTNLNITLSFKGGSEMFNNSPETLISHLTNILLTTPNLKHLELSFTDPDKGYRNWPIQSLSKPLSKLQAAFDSLKRLHSLRINGIFVHPSFFLKVPKSVRKLELRCMTTPLWWLSFATYPFHNVEDLVLYNKPGEFRWRDKQSERIHGLDLDDSDWKFLLESVSISTLKRFSGRAPLCGPIDILDCVLANNKGLKGKHKFIKDCRDEVLPDVESCALIMLDCLSESIMQYKKQYTWKYQQLNGRTDVQYAKEFSRQCLKSLEKRVNEVYGQHYIYEDFPYELD
ncbi:hypothetical protein EYR41_007307 [Orbilia oligospora]|uniref:Uncharacterized protein n=1 Tax=Orbilia oligospora TaxID=2813651 RepID=A0A7C8KFC6_ORBOL|nr:hypothetical protein TWF751_011017 [Orbilia oligospora]KAF3295837.1 hypothetical protein TWF132_000388 [Orbilia oligospora]TGJ68246.1 hypothetical protein EYR41_007307 [Orbilia oligospora]